MRQRPPRIVFNATANAHPSDLYADQGMDRRREARWLEVLLEFQDQFGDPTKAGRDGHVRIVDYRQAIPIRAA